MAFASPLWLVGLGPWAALAVWVIWGRAPEAHVPFLKLWLGTAGGWPAKAGWRRPPVGVIAMLLAALAGLLGAAGPMLEGGGLPAVSIIVDRGITMSARGRQRERFKEVVEENHLAIERWLRKVREVELVSVPGGTVRSGGPNWSRIAQELKPTAVETKAALEAAVSTALARQRGPVIVFSDRKLRIAGARLVQIAPAGGLEDVAIAALGVSERAGGQVMVKVANASKLGTAKLSVQSGDQTVQRLVELPPRGEERDEFIDLPVIGHVVEAKLEVQDDLAANNRAWLVRQAGRPRLEVRTALSPPVARMIDIYHRRRLASGASQTLAVVGDIKDLAADARGVVCNRADRKAVAGPIAASGHEITDGIDWSELDDVKVTGEALAGWEPIVSVGGKAIVAVASGPPRRVWVGFESDKFAKRSDFVFFWARVLEWAGAGQEAFAAGKVGDWGLDWEIISQGREQGVESGSWPGVYRNSEGKLAAVNALGVKQAEVVKGDWQLAMARLAKPANSIDMRPEVLLVAAGMVVLAAGAWSRRGSRVTSS